MAAEAYQIEQKYVKGSGVGFFESSFLIYLSILGVHKNVVVHFDKVLHVHAIVFNPSPRNQRFEWYIPVGVNKITLNYIPVLFILQFDLRVLGRI